VEKSEEISTGRGEIDGVNANATHTGKLKSLITPTTTVRMAFVVCINQAQKHRSGLSFCRVMEGKDKKYHFFEKRSAAPLGQKAKLVWLSLKQQPCV
jgi:hypothetical protein